MTLLKWIWRLAEGFIPHTGERVGKMVWVLGLFILFTLGSNALSVFKKPNGENYKGATIGTVINCPDPKRDVAYIGCGLWRGEVKVRIQQ